MRCINFNLLAIKLSAKMENPVYIPASSRQLIVYPYDIRQKGAQIDINGNA